MPQRIAVLGTGDADTQATQVPQPIVDIATPGVEPILLPVPGAVFPGTPAARDIAVAAYTAAGLAAAADGFDAIYINTVGDYGLEALRAQVDIPVVGAGEAAILAARKGGQRFSIVTLWPPGMAFIYRHIIEASSAASACCNIHFMSDDADLTTLDRNENPIVRMQACDFIPMQTVKQTCERALTQDGCATLILGCTCMAGMAPLLQTSGFPLIEPMRTGYQLAVASL